MVEYQLAKALSPLLTCLSSVPAVCRTVWVLMTCQMSRQLCTTLPPVIKRPPYTSALLVNVSLKFRVFYCMKQHFFMYFSTPAVFIAYLTCKYIS